MVTTEKVSVSIEKQLLKRTDEYAKRHYMKRSAVLNLALSQLMAQDEIITTLEVIRNLLTKISENKKLTAEEQEQMKRIDVLCNALVDSAE